MSIIEWNRSATDVMQTTGFLTTSMQAIAIIPTANATNVTAAGARTDHAYELLET